MDNYNDGEIHLWKGGDCPVHRKTVVNIWSRGGVYKKILASMWRWNHNKAIPASEIIAFQVVKEYKEPKEFWINVYDTNETIVFPSKKSADKFKNYFGLVRSECIHVREVEE